MSTELEMSVADLATELVRAGWTSARVEHLGGNVEGVRIDIPEHVIQRRVVTPPMILLITTHGEAPCTVGCYDREEGLGSEPIGYTDVLSTGAYGYQDARTFTELQQVLDYYRSIQVDPRKWF